MPTRSKTPLSPGRQDKRIYLWLFLIAFAVVFSSTYNPVNFRRMHNDSSVYITISKGIIQGQLPYGDFIDNKGPLAFFINVPGLFFGGFTGVWITELIFLFVSVLFAYKTALLFGDKHKAFIGTALGFVTLLAFFTVYAGTEEYSLPFLMISFYLFTKHLLSDKQNFKFGELIVLGICFTCAVMIRINMFPLWAGFCMVIFFEAIAKRHFISAGKYVLGFLLGVLIIFIPIYLYLRLNNIFDSFITQVIFSGASRGFNSTSLKTVTKYFFSVINRTFSIAPVFFGIFYMITKYKQTEFIYYLGYTFSYFLMVLFLSFSWGDNHYNMILVPFFIPALTILAGIIYNALPAKKGKYLIVICFLCVILFEGISKYFYDFSKIFFDKSGQQIIKAGKMIDDNTMPEDKILSINNAYIYPFTQRTIASKFCYQGSGITPIPGAREAFLSEVMTNKPAVIAVTTVDGKTPYEDYWHEPIMEMMETEYHLFYNENGFELYRRNN